MARYLRLSIKGGIGPTEVWSVNPVIDPRDELTFDFDQTTFDAFTQAVAALTVPNSLKNAMSTAVNIRSIRAELRDTATVGFIGASEYTLPTPIVRRNAGHDSSDVGGHVAADRQCPGERARAALLAVPREHPADRDAPPVVGHRTADGL